MKLIEPLKTNKMDKPTYDKEMMLKLLFHKIKNKEIGKTHFEYVLNKYTTPHKTRLLYELIQREDYSFEEFKNDLFIADEKNVEFKSINKATEWFSKNYTTYKSTSGTINQVETYE